MLTVSGFSYKSLFYENMRSIVCLMHTILSSKGSTGRFGAQKSPGPTDRARGGTATPCGRVVAVAPR